jgi:c-di-GMP-binding flagellar brake protein YcgR
VGEAAADLLRVREHPVALWTLEVVGAPMITQRRRYARTAVTLPMQLDVEVEEDEVGPVLGSTVDIGEGGVHCIARGLDEVEIGAPVAVTLEVDGRRVDAQGRVLRMKPLHDGFRSVVVTFDQLDRRDADHIRRFVFASSLRSPVRESV